MGRDGKRFGVQDQPWLHSREFKVSLHYVRAYLKKERREEEGGIRVDLGMEGLKDKAWKYRDTRNVSTRWRSHPLGLIFHFERQSKLKVPRFKNILNREVFNLLHLTFLIYNRNGNISLILGEVGGMRQGLM